MINKYKKIITNQFPEYNNLEIKEVEKQGHDNFTFRLGDSLVARFPQKEKYDAAIAKDFELLKHINQYIKKYKIPIPINLGKPSKEYSYHFLISQYINGSTVTHEIIDLNEILLELHSVPPINITPSRTNFYRGAHPNIYKQQTLELLKKYNLSVNHNQLNKYYSSSWNNPPVLVHGDLMPSNIIIKNNKINGIIDWECSTFGDPACDLIIYWLHNNIVKPNVDEETYYRGAIWALWKALVNINSENLEQNISIANNIIKDIKI